MSVDSVGGDDDFVRARPLDIFIAIDIDATASLLDNIDAATGLLDKPLEQGGGLVTLGVLKDTIKTKALLGSVLLADGS